MPSAMGRYLRVCMGQEERADRVPLVNERQKQTYYGALNFYTQKFLVKAYEKGNSQSTIAFLQYLRFTMPPKPYRPDLGRS